MPHVSIKLYSGRDEEAKVRLTEKIAQAVVEETGCRDAVVSVAIQEVEPEDWAQTVYQPDILDCKGILYKKPGYNPFDSSSPAEQKAEKETEKGLMDYVRGAAQTAGKEDTTGVFNPMSWLDLELEENPHSFDPYFNRHWDTLSDEEKGKRAAAIRQAL
jgi:4-oxalocrotonate tautomerase